MSFSGEDHRHSAALLDAIERVYGSAGPDYLEVWTIAPAGSSPCRRGGRTSGLAGHAGRRRVSSPAELLALNDGTSMQGEARLVAELEREQLRLADRLLWPGGDILGLYRRYYTDVSLPEAVLMRHPFAVPAAPPSRPGWIRPAAENPLRGQAAASQGRSGPGPGLSATATRRLELTMIGADTQTAPLGQSARMTIEEMTRRPALRSRSAPPRRASAPLVSDMTWLSSPSTFEVWRERRARGDAAGTASSGDSGGRVRGDGE